MIVVAGASPFIALERISRLDLLAALYEEVVIPEAVYAELAPRSPTFEAGLPVWVRVHRAGDGHRIVGTGPQSGALRELSRAGAWRAHRVLVHVPPPSGLRRFLLPRRHIRRYYRSVLDQEFVRAA